MVDDRWGVADGVRLDPRVEPEDDRFIVSRGDWVCLLRNDRCGTLVCIIPYDWVGTQVYVAV